MTAPDPDVVRRLATIRLLLDRAVDAAHGPAPFDAESLSRLHDVIEMWLALAVKVHGLGIPKNLETYWDVLAKVLGRPLGYAGRVQTLNKVRVAFKHYEAEPSKRSILDAAQTAQALLEDETEALFGVQLADASLLSFVTSARAQELLATAEVKMAADDHLHAFADLSDAFDAVIDDYLRTKKTGYDTTVFSLAPAMRNVSRFMSSTRNSDFERATAEGIAELERAVVITGLGVDLRRWGRFKSIVPEMVHTVTRRQIIHDRGFHLRARTPEDYVFCRDFIVNTAIHLSEVDYQFDDWRSRQEQRAREERVQQDGP